jgi:hypothetical protein
MCGERSGVSVTVLRVVSTLIGFGQRVPDIRIRESHAVCTRYQVCELIVTIRIRYLIRDRSTFGICSYWQAGSIKQFYYNTWNTWFASILNTIGVSVKPHKVTD